LGPGRHCPKQHSGYSPNAWLEAGRKWNQKLWISLKLRLRAYPNLKSLLTIALLRDIKDGGAETISKSQLRCFVPISGKTIFFSQLFPLLTRSIDG